ncbi:MAG: alanine racemase [Spirochaetaceae bacterium]
MKKIQVNRLGILSNLKKIQTLCKNNGCELVPVTKLVHSYQEMLSELINGDIKMIAEVNLDSIKQIELPVKKMLLKTSPSAIRDILLNCDVALVSELDVLREINKYAKSRYLDIIVPIELGDLREGIYPNEVVDFFREALKLVNLNIVGFSVNFGCLAGKLPDDESLLEIQEIKKNLIEELNYTPQVVSLGGTVIIDMLKEGKLKGIANQVRIGEAIYFGYNTSGGAYIEGLEQNNFIFQAEIIEVKEKEVLNKGKMGLNAFGESFKSNKSGIRKRAVLNFGSLTVPPYGIIPVDSSVQLEGMTHDLSVFDITNSTYPYKPGSIMEFRLNYSGAAQAFLNKHIAIIIN